MTDKLVNKSNVTGTCGGVVADILQDDGLMITGDQVVYCMDIVQSSITIPKYIKRVQLGSFVECESLVDYYYAGTMDEWSQVMCEPTWIDVVHCVDGDYRMIDDD